MAKFQTPNRWQRTGFLTAAGVLALAMIVVAWNVLPTRAPAKTVQDPVPQELDSNTPVRSASAEHSPFITLRESAWEAAGLKVEPAQILPFRETVRVTGTITLNEDRVAHLYPLVEGRVEQVPVRFGQKVAAGDVLAVIQSKEVGERKLELVQARLAQEIARVGAERSELLSTNTQLLIDALNKEMPLDRLEEEFSNRPMGGHREQLVTAYSALVKASADYDRLEELSGKGVTSTKDFAAARAVRDAARATYAALLDETGFEVQQEALAKKHTLAEIEARVAAAETFLAILGYSKDDLAKIDPTIEGKSLSHYPIVAPFDGTVLTKDAALLESVGPDRQMFEIADLSTVWVVIDLYERHLPLIEGLQDKAVRVRSTVFPDRAIKARVFFTAATVDPQTRTARIRAVADNTDGRLRPGMFVEVELPAGDVDEVLQIPESSLQNHEGSTFTFVYRGGDRFERRELTPGRRANGFVEILEGLATDESVVVAGGFALKSRLLADLLVED